MTSRTKVKFAVICASNQNRSMAAHHVLKNEGFDVNSYGTNREVRLPGPAVDKPNVYPFQTPYDDIYHDLLNKDPQLYNKNGLLAMLERNRKIKRAPEQFKMSADLHDVIITCEERCFDSVCEDLLERRGKKCYPVHIINVEIKDNHEEASRMAYAILEICDQIETQVERGRNIEDELESVLDAFQVKHGDIITHAVSYYYPRELLFVFFQTILLKFTTPFANFVRINNGPSHTGKR